MIYPFAYAGGLNTDNDATIAPSINSTAITNTILTKRLVRFSSLKVYCLIVQKGLKARRTNT